MDSKYKELWVGVTVLTAIISLVALTIYFGKGETVRFGEEYTIKVRFQRTPGIAKRSPVYKNGVKIGLVTSVELVDEDREVEITIRLPEARKIYTDEECRVRQTVIMGDATLEFVKDINFKGEIKLVGSDSPPLVGRESNDILRSFSNLEGDLNKTLQVISGAVERIGEFVDRANIIIGTPDDAKVRHDRIDEVVAELQQTMSAIRAFSSQAGSFVGDQKLQNDFKQIVSSLPEILSKSQSLFSNAESLLSEGRGFVKHGNDSLSKVDAAVGNITKITEQAKDDIPDIMNSLKTSSTKLQMLFEEIILMVRAFQKSEGTIGRMLHDPEAYEKLLETLNNIEKITKDVNLLIRTDIKPISTNLRHLSDEIARDPSIFIRNLIKKRPPVKGGLPVWGDGLGSDKMLNSQFGFYESQNQNQCQNQNYNDYFDLPCCPVCYGDPCFCEQKSMFSILVPNCIAKLFLRQKKQPTSSGCGDVDCDDVTCAALQNDNIHTNTPNLTANSSQNNFSQNNVAQNNVVQNNTAQNNATKNNAVQNRVIVQDNLAQKNNLAQKRSAANSNYAGDNLRQTSEVESKKVAAISDGITARSELRHQQTGDVGAELDGVIINNDPRYPAVFGTAEIVPDSVRR
ncbi:MAG: MlaD family protein [Planctomycetaceae bacterium]|jgi:phospholipid/cholesterol/gamma-HCH transport system substrate-binding protein|nr:MlaD family protein [Planctomycetaceae bacterium]